MKLSQSQLKKLKQLDIVKATHEARDENYKLLNDQGFSILALIISNLQQIKSRYSHQSNLQ